MLALMLLIAATAGHGPAPSAPAMRIGARSDPVPSRRAPARTKRQRDRFDPYVVADHRWKDNREDCLRRKNREVTSCLMPRPLQSDYMKMPRP
jgi:hypothetical protein